MPTNGSQSISVFPPVALVPLLLSPAPLPLLRTSCSMMNSVHRNGSFSPTGRPTFNSFGRPLVRAPESSVPWQGRDYSTNTLCLKVKVFDFSPFETVTLKGVLAGASKVTLSSQWPSSLTSATPLPKSDVT